MGPFRRKREKLTITPETIGANGFGAPLHISYGYRELPGSGARQYAYDTLALPMYSPIGWGVQNKQSFDPSGSPVVGWDQTIGIESLFWNGNPSGQVVGQPLVNADSPNNPDGLIVAAFNAPGANELPG